MKVRHANDATHAPETIRCNDEYEEKDGTEKMFESLYVSALSLDEPSAKRVKRGKNEWNHPLPRFEVR